MPYRYYVDLGSLHGKWKEGLLILMYHSIEAQTPGAPWQELYVDPAKMREQISELIAGGVRFIRADDLLRQQSRERQVLITFDDGFQNISVNALPIFRELGVPAIAYIVAGALGGSNTWDHAMGLLKKPLMSREEILEWVEAGFDIGSHSLTHAYLTKLPLAQARKEIFDSKKILEDLIGKPIRHFNYPYGDLNAAIRELVIEAGYETACSCVGGYNYPQTDRFKLRRRGVRS